MRLTDFLIDIGRPVAYYPRLSHITGGVKETLFLCQLLYWNGKQANKNSWIYKTQKEMLEETGLSRYEQETARRNLREKGFIKETRKGIPAKMHYKIDLDAINKAWEDFIKKETSNNDDVAQTSMGGNHKLECGNATNTNDETQQTITENTHRLQTEIVNNPFLRECLNQLKQIKNYPFDIEKDIEFINTLLVDFPTLDIKEELKKWAIYKLDKPLTKKSNARSQFRNWCKKSAEWRAEKEPVESNYNKIKNISKPLPPEELEKKFREALGC